MFEKEKGAGEDDARERKASSSILPSDHSGVNVQTLPWGEKLPKWEASRSSRQAVSRINHLLMEWRSKTHQTCFLVGKELIWLKVRLAHGEFGNAVVEASNNSMTLRTAQRLMKYAKECDLVDRLLSYNPNPKSKGDTVSLLNPPEPDKGKLEKPKAKDAETDWTEDGAANLLLEYFIKLTHHCSIEEKESVAQKSVQALQDHIATERDEWEEKESVDQE